LISELRILRATAYAGLAVVGLFVLSALILPLTDAPATTSSAEEVARFTAEHRSELIAVLWITALGFAVLFVFFAGLRHILSAAEGVPPLLSGLGFASGAALVIVLWVSLGFWTALAYRMPEEANTAVARALTDLTWVGFAISGFPTIIALTAFSLVILRTAILPPFVAWAGFIVAAAHVLSTMTTWARSGAYSLSGDIATTVPVLFYVWLLIVSVALLRRPLLAAPAGAPAMPESRDPDPPTQSLTPSRPTDAPTG
jgi:hypothetical protein